MGTRMKTLFNLGKHKIINSSCIDVLKDHDNNHFTSIISDWPFKQYKNLLSDVVNESTRVLCKGGSFISIHYPDENYYVRSECEKYNLLFGDEIAIKSKVSYILNNNQLPKQRISILVMVKNLENRLWNYQHQKLGRLLDARSSNVVTDFWDDKHFKNGYKGKGIGKHSEAIPRWVADKLIDTFVPKDGKVLDLFGGAGTILLKCMQKNIPCISSEIDENNCILMEKRIKYGY